MPFSGTIGRKVSFTRITAGSMGRFSGVTSGIMGAARAVSGILQLTGGAIARKVKFTRDVGGSFTWNGIGQRVYAKFTRSVAGALHFSGNTSIATGVNLIKRGLNKLGFNLRMD